MSLREPSRQLSRAFHDCNLQPSGNGLGEGVGDYSTNHLVTFNYRSCFPPPASPLNPANLPNPRKRGRVSSFLPSPKVYVHTYIYIRVFYLEEVTVFSFQTWVSFIATLCSQVGKTVGKRIRDAKREAKKRVLFPERERESSIGDGRVSVEARAIRNNGRRPREEFQSPKLQGMVAARS